jgi:meso-butanediol dehydrogenase/(S,S)-butanediol dehydrogenase/diacetyl reductase
VGLVADFPEEQWDRVMAVNAKGPFLCAKACIPHMLRNKEGAIINTASIAGKTGRGGASAYCASKFAVIAFTQALAEELGPSNIRVNAVCPGFLRTAMWTEVLNKVQGLLGRGEGDGTVDNLTHVALHGTYLRREQTPDDIGDAVVYLARADNITGETLNVAGGAEAPVMVFVAAMAVGMYLQGLVVRPNWWRIFARPPALPALRPIHDDS